MIRVLTLRTNVHPNVSGPRTVTHEGGQTNRPLCSHGKCAERLKHGTQNLLTAVPTRFVLSLEVLICIAKIGRACRSVPFDTDPWSRVRDHFVWCLKRSLDVSEVSRWSIRDRFPAFPWGSTVGGLCCTTRCASRWSRRYRAPDYESGGRRFESFRARACNILTLPAYLCRACRRVC